jgi:hypothetical protein
MRHPHQPQQGLLRIRHFKHILYIVLIVIVLYPFSYIYAALSCSVTTAAACTGSSVVLLRMSGSTNAHAELPSQSNANYASNVVCCTASGIGNSCSGNFQRIGRLSAVTNAHVQQTSVNTYGSSACLSDTAANDTITVGYQNTNCTGYDTTLFSMTATDNATVGDGSAYTIKACATVIPQTISFDIDSATTNTDTNPPYIIALGTLTTAQASNSDNSAINSIWADIATNAVGGIAVSVISSKGALKSTSISTDTIPSATGTMVAGTANYGVCIGSVTQSSGATLTKASPFNGATCTSSHVNTVGVVTTSAQNILTASGAIVGGRSEIRVNAENSNATPAHNDYSDTLTFIATGTF